MSIKYDFSGWATKNDLKCSDGRTIRRDAFKDCDGKTVPLVWNHQHDGPSNVLGHALLENRNEGVYAYCSFNNTDEAEAAKELVKHGDIKALSIYANHLKQKGGDVLHGAIREVSLVLGGANPGAFIDAVMAHGDSDEGEAVISIGEKDTELWHADMEMPEQEPTQQGPEPTVQDVFNSLNEDQKSVVYALIAQAVEQATGSQQMAQSDSNEDVLSHADETVRDVWNTLNEKQKNVVYALIDAAIKNESDGGDEDMKHNVFDNTPNNEEDVLQHSDIVAIFNDAKQYGSLKESALAHGITDIEYLFPDARNATDTPTWIKRDDEWVSDVMSSTHHVPFSRIKSMFADITEDDARAKGFLATYKRDELGNKVKMDGNKAYKKEEVFSLLKRTTTPTTVYKKQKLDRDDVVDITDFDVVAWIKTEMRSMLNEELARAYLIGDGRSSASDDKINEQNIRPILTDNNFFTLKATLTVPATADEEMVARGLIKLANKARKRYKGSGTPTFYTTDDYITDMLLIEDTNQRRIYNSEDDVAKAMRAKKLVNVPVMENYDTGKENVELAGLLVNLTDYWVGADKGGAVNMFDDFDIDYNAQKYLIETRCSGALVKPYSAIAMYVKRDAAAQKPSFEVIFDKNVSAAGEGVSA